MFSFSFNRTVQRLIYALLILGLAWFWILLSASPALAEEGKFLNYSNAQLTGQDFSNQDLETGLFVSAEMRDVNFSGANLKFDVHEG